MAAKIEMQIISYTVILPDVLGHLPLHTNEI